MWKIDRSKFDETITVGFYSENRHWNITKLVTMSMSYEATAISLRYFIL